ncbi:MAG: class I SAM-dependent methyltransferase [Burkholderiaceae bacterium]|nr:class I SAM-dependent methyltransferase [Microbacteriaceae bacterium]
MSTCGARGSRRIRLRDVPFRLASLKDLGVEPRSVDAILAWYSVIHLTPSEVPPVLGEFARCLAPGGRLRLGFFDGDTVEPFSHAVTNAYFWPVARMREQLELAGFQVVAVPTRTDPGARPHAAIVATRPAD